MEIKISPSCPLCLTFDVYVLGLLGNIKHWRCNNCGITWHD